MTDAFPLTWPEGWPRTPAEKRQDGSRQFQRRDQAKGYGSKAWTFAGARDALFDELERLSGRTVVSTNFRLSRGVATDTGRRPDDQGVAIYFERGGRPMAMACDRYERAEENMRSLTLSLEALRTLERHGGGVMVEKAFTGFAALPAPRSPWEVLGLAPGADKTAIETVYRALARKAHPDVGGSPGAMAELNAARHQALKEAS